MINYRASSCGLIDLITKHEKSALRLLNLMAMIDGKIKKTTSSQLKKMYIDS